MRLRELEDILILSQPGLGQLKQSPQPTGFVQCSGVLSVRKSMEILNQLAPLQSIIAAARGTAIFQSVNDTVILSQEAAHQIVSLTQQLNGTVSSMIGAIRVVEIPEQSPYSLSVKLPPTSTLENLISVLKLCQQGFDRPAYDLIGEGTHIEGFDRGSFWIELAVATPMAFKIIAKILEMVKKYRIDRLEVDYAFEALRSKKIQNDHLQALQATTQEQLENFAKSYADEVINQCASPDKDLSQFNETRVSIANSIKEFDRLIDKGLEVHPAFNASIEVQKLMPQPLSAATMTPAQLPARAESSATPDRNE